MHPEPETSWQKLVNDFRRLCVARRQDNREVADRLMSRDLPERIAEWSREGTLNAAERRTQLMQMFEREQRRVDDAWVLHDLMSVRVVDEVLPVLRAQVFEAVREATGVPVGADARLRSVQHPGSVLHRRKRVNITDIPGVIDLLLEQELRSEARTAPRATPASAPETATAPEITPCLP